MATEGMPPISQLKGRPLGRILIKMGKVTRAQVSEALELQKKKRGPLPPVLVVGCEPTPGSATDDLDGELSPPVRAAVEESLALIQSLIERLCGPAGRGRPSSCCPPPARSSSPCTRS